MSRQQKSSGISWVIFLLFHSDMPCRLIFRPEPADFSGIPLCPHFPQPGGTRYGVQTSFTNQPLTGIGQMRLMKTKLRRRLDRSVTRSVLITKSRFHTQVAGWMIHAPRGCFCARFFDDQSDGGSGGTKLLILYLVFAATLSTRYRNPKSIGFPAWTDDWGWLQDMRPDGDNCALPLRQDAAAKDNGRCA